MVPFYYLCVGKRSLMPQIQQLSLLQLQQLLGNDNNRMANNYISQNLAVVRNVDPDIMKMQFRQEPILLPEMRILIMKKGWTNPTINLTKHHFVEGDLVFVGKDGIIQVDEVSNDVSGIAFSINQELFALAIGNSIPKAFNGHLRNFHFRLEAAELDFLDRLHQLLYESSHQSEGSGQVTLHLISTLLWYVDHLWSRHEQEMKTTLSREERLFADFIALVNQHAPQQHHINFYAERLFLSPRYMSTLVKKVSGRAAKEWIDDAIVAHIKIELKHSQKQVGQIADEMNFANTAFFCKYFRRMTGMSPSAYRSA